MLSWKYFVNFLSNWYSMSRYRHNYTPVQIIEISYCDALAREKKMYYNQNSSCFSNDDDNLTTVITKGSISLLAILIFLFDVNSLDVSMTSSTLKTLIKFWGACFKFLLRSCYVAFKEGTLDSYIIKLYMQ